MSNKTTLFFYSKLFSLSIITLSYIFISGCNKTKSTNQPSDEFAKNYTIKPKMIDDMLILEITLGPGLHAYAKGEKIGKPVHLEILPKNGWSSEGSPLIPEGQKKQLSPGNESVVLEGRFLIKQKVKKGKSEGQAALHLQVCSKDACDRPRIHEIALK